MFPFLVMVWLWGACAPAGQGSPASQAQPGQPALSTRTLVAAVRGEPDGLAPRMIGQNLSISSYLARRMFNADLALLDDQEEPHPYLAEALPQLNTDSWKVFPDGTMETIYRLKPNLVWHDGTALTADDLVFSWELYGRPELGSGASPPISLMQAIAAPDARTIVIHWTQPYPAAGALQSAAPGAAGLPPLPRSILGPALDSGAEDLLNSSYWTTGFVGFGPYRLDNWEPGAFLEAAAFDRHALGAPRIPRIKVLFVGDGNTTLAAMLAGQVLLAADSGLNPPQAAELLRQWPPGAGSMSSQSRNWKAAHFQNRPELASPAALQDLRVRKALAHALDKPAINDAVNDGQDLISDSMFPPTSALGRAANAAVTKYPFDPRKSGQFMAEAGFTRGSDGIYVSPTGRRVTAELMTSAGGATEMAAVASGWRQAGFEFQESATPAALAQDRRYRSTFSGIQIITSALGERGILSLASTSIPGPENNWRSVGSAATYAGYSSPEMDRLVAAYTTALAAPDRIQAAVEIAKLHNSDFPAIPMFFPTAPWLFASGLSGPTSVATESNMAWNIHEWELK